MKTSGSTNPEMRRVIVGLKKLKKYSELVKQLERPRRRRSSVNLSDIEKLNHHKIATTEVLGSGEMTKSVNVYAWRFSKSAKEKIEKAGGKALSLDDLLRNKDEVVVV